MARAVAVRPLAHLRRDICVRRLSAASHMSTVRRPDTACSELSNFMLTQALERAVRCGDLHGQLQGSA